MIDIDFNKVDLAFPKVLAKKLNLLKEAMTDVIDDENVSLYTTYSSQKIVELVNRFGFSIQVVDELPSRGKKNTIYLVPALDESIEHMSILYADGTYPQHMTNPQPSSKLSIGDVIKCTRENPDPESDEEFTFATAVNLEELELDGELFGVTTEDYEQNAFYQVNGIYDLPESVGGDIIGQIYTFEQTEPTEDYIDVDEFPAFFEYRQHPSQDIKDEYIWVNSQWEKIGSTRIDLSQYYTKTETDSLLDKKVDKIYPTPLCFTAQQAGSTISITNTGDNAPNIEISTNNGGTWTIWDYSTITLNNIDDTVLMRGMNPNGFSKSDSMFSEFVITGIIAASGNIMSLIDYTEEVDTIPCSYCFIRAFHNCSSLTAAPELPATTLAKSCYGAMFNGCTSLTAAPALPATIMKESCYEGMFYVCTGLTSAPELPATILAQRCYANMFRGCTALTTAPELPAKTLSTYCYNSMFEGCIALTKTPILPATTLEYGCYSSMFFGCTALTTAPELPAKTLAQRCYYQMFKGCTSLNYIKCLATDISATYCTLYWVQNVAASGTFVKDANMTNWSTSSSYYEGIPTGWTVVNHYDDIALQNALDGKSNVGHTHTKSEITDFAHTHVIADITDFVITTAETIEILNSPETPSHTILHLNNGNPDVEIEADVYNTLKSERVSPYLSTLEYVEIGTDVSKIDIQTFEGCTTLSHVIIPANVTIIDHAAFKDCSGLTYITLYCTTPPTIGGVASYMFSNTNNCPLYVPTESVETYKATTGWSTYASRIQAIPTT